ncbi:hypothetical protein [Brevundimonas sp. GN22]
MSDTLIDDNEILYRQIHPSFIVGGVPSSQGFQPTPKDDNKLSVDRSTIFSASESYDNYTSGGLASSGVYGVSVAEFREENIECVSDPLPKTAKRDENPAHALADYKNVEKVKHTAKRLKNKAIARGRSHP